MDILIVFNSALDQSMVNYIDDRKQIAIIYLKGWFFIDVLSIFPFELLILIMVDKNSTDDFENVGGNNELLRLMRISKLYKLIKITRLLRLFKLMRNNG